MIATVAVATVIVGSAALIPGQIPSTPPVDPPPAGTANLWIDQNGGTCTRSSSPVAYTGTGDTTSCSSFDAAYGAASLGDTVLIKGGAYGAQAITNKSGKDTSGDLADVVISAADGETVTVASLSMGSGVLATDGPDHITIRHVYDNNIAQGQSGSCQWVLAAVDLFDITLDDVRMCNAYINAHDGTVACIGSGLTIKNSEFTGCTMPEDSSDCGSAGNIKFDAFNNVTFENNYIHDFVTTNPATNHLECIFISRMNGGMFRNNRFQKCDVYNVFHQHGGPVSSTTSIANITYENNWFDCARATGGGCRTQALAFSPRNIAFTNILIRFNSFNAGGGVSVNDDGDGTTYSNFRIYGNVIGATMCGSGVDYQYNVFIGGNTCGTNAITAAGSSVYVNANTLDLGGNYHLLNGSVADAYVTPDTADFQLSTDRDGDARSAPRDAGADEH